MEGKECGLSGAWSQYTFLLHEARSLLGEIAEKCMDWADGVWMREARLEVAVGFR